MFIWNVILHIVSIDRFDSKAIANWNPKIAILKSIEKVISDGFGNNEQ